MISLQDALDSYSRTLSPLAEESVPATESLHRVLSQPAVSMTDLPRFTQSAVDGYALRSADTIAAHEATPVRLHIGGEIAAGAIDKLPSLGPGECWRILTGGSVPAGADSIAPQEIVAVKDGHILLSVPIRENRNIRHRGEELKKGDAMAFAGQRVTPGLLSAVVMAGITTLSVRKRPRIHVLVTGDEVRPAGGTLRDGEIHDSNAPLIRNWLLSMGYPEPRVDHVSDTSQAVLHALEQAFETADLVITTGGVSVGDRDFIPGVAEELGIKKQFWKVAQKPGKPLFYGLRGTKVLLGLPGNPGAVLIGLVMHIRKVLDCLEGAAHPGAVMYAGRLTAAVKADTQRDRLVRMEVSVDADGLISLLPLGRQDSHMLSNLSTASALVLLPVSDTDYPAGTIVRWTSLPGMCFI